MAHFLGDQLRGVGVDHVVDLQHLSLLHQQADHVDRAFGHAVGEIGNRDRLGDGDFAHELFLRLGGGLTLEPLGAAAERCDRTLAHLVGTQRGDQREPAALFRRRATRRGGTCRGRTRGAGTARLRRPVIVFDFQRHAAWTRLADFILAKTLLGDFAGLALGFLVVLAALVFLTLARLGGFALGLVDDFAALAAARFFLGDLALFGFAHARIRQRMGARDALFLGQGAQHNAGRLGGLGGRWRGFARGGRLSHGLDRRRLGLDLGRSTDAAAFDLLDHDLLAAAVTEALAYHARLGARLERQLANAEFLFAGILSFAHSEFCPCAPSVGACALTSSGEFPVRKRSKRLTRARKVSLTGPASRAACTTFGRFNAKSNWVPENVSTIAVSPDFSGVLRCNAASSLRFPSAAASAA